MTGTIAVSATPVRTGPALSVTIDDVVAWGPCYGREKIESLFAGRPSLTALDILNLDIPVRDRFWAAMREELIPGPILHEFACQVAEECLDAAEATGSAIDPRSREAIRVKRLWLRGEATDAEMSAAESAAWSAAESAAWSAAESAAWSAAESAEMSAVRSAAWSAAWSAQIEKLKAMLAV